MEKEREIKRKEGREKEDRIKMGLDTRRACWWSERERWRRKKGRAVVQQRVVEKWVGGGGRRGGGGAGGGGRGGWGREKGRVDLQLRRESQAVTDRQTNLTTLSFSSFSLLHLHSRLASPMHRVPYTSTVSLFTSPRLPPSTLLDISLSPSPSLSLSRPRMDSSLPLAPSFLLKLDLSPFLTFLSASPPPLLLPRVSTSSSFSLFLFSLPCSHSLFLSLSLSR